MEVNFLTSMLHFVPWFAHDLRATALKSSGAFWYWFARSLSRVIPLAAALSAKYPQ